MSDELVGHYDAYKMGVEDTKAMTDVLARRLRIAIAALEKLTISEENRARLDEVDRQMLLTVVQHSHAVAEDALNRIWDEGEQ